MGDRFGDGEREVCERRARTGGLVVVSLVGEEGRLITPVVARIGTRKEMGRAR